MFQSKTAFARRAAIALAFSTPAFSAAPAFAESVAAVEARAAALDPGEYVWQPQLATSGEIEIVVSLPQQVAYVFRGGTLIGVSTVSTGKPGNDTPTGSFEILQKRREHYSNLYDNAPMPFMQRLTWDGIALHAGAIPGRPASHGCVRLPMAFARHLFAATELGARVHIVDAAPAAPREALTLASGAGRGTQLATAD
jgi:lipoprotein-anchoring transpeptidase ErfK/SrfK